MYNSLTSPGPKNESPVLSCIIKARFQLLSMRYSCTFVFQPAKTLFSSVKMLTSPTYDVTSLLNAKLPLSKSLNKAYIILLIGPRSWN